MSSSEQALILAQQRALEGAANHYQYAYCLKLKSPRHVGEIIWVVTAALRMHTRILCGGMKARDLSKRQARAAFVGRAVKARIAKALRVQA